MATLDGSIRVGFVGGGGTVAWVARVGVCQRVSIGILFGWESVQGMGAAPSSASTCAASTAHCSAFQLPQDDINIDPLLPYPKRIGMLVASLFAATLSQYPIKTRTILVKICKGSQRIRVTMPKSITRRHKKLNKHIFFPKQCGHVWRHLTVPGFDRSKAAETPSFSQLPSSSVFDGNLATVPTRSPHLELCSCLVPGYVNVFFSLQGQGKPDI